KEQRRHLPGDDEEDPGRGLHDCRSAGAPLPSRVRQVAVLQLPAALQDGGRRHQAVVHARHPSRAPPPRARPGPGGPPPARPARPRGACLTDSIADPQHYYLGRRAMITGGLGSTASNLARRLASLGANVLIVDSLLPDYGGNFFNTEEIADRVRVNIADVRT